MTTVNEAIAGMEALKSSEEILIAWWDKQWFEDILNTKLSEEEWAEIRHLCEKTMEHCGWGDDLTNTAWDVLNTRKATA